MKKIYILGIVFFLGLLYGCSKDFLKSYDKRIIGTWRISDVNRVGLGGDADNLPFGAVSLLFMRMERWSTPVQQTSGSKEPGIL
ncbi:MAG: hypothetical protein WDO16_07135 [Bacteroidota bacterium]